MAISQERDEQGSSKSELKHQLVARVSAAHGVFDVNTVVWCPRTGAQNVFATAGDDGHVKVWKFIL